MTATTYVEREKHRILVRVIGGSSATRHFQYDTTEQAISVFESIKARAESDGKKPVLHSTYEMTIRDWDYIKVMADEAVKEKRRAQRRNAKAKAKGE